MGAKGKSVGLDAAARFTSEISNYACRKLEFEEGNAKVALYSKLHE